MIDFFEAKELAKDVLEEFAPEIYVELSDETLKAWLWEHRLVDTVTTKEMNMETD